MCDQQEVADAFIQFSRLLDSMSAPQDLDDPNAAYFHLVCEISQAANKVASILKRHSENDPVRQRETIVCVSRKVSDSHSINSDNFRQGLHDKLR